MNLSDNDTYHVWQPDLYGIVQLAIEQKSEVFLHCHYKLDECNSADLTIMGIFVKLSGQHAQFVVEDYDFSYSANFPKAPDCEYKFAIDLPKSEAGKSRIEYAGKAAIIDQELQKNNLPEFLLLRLSLPTHIRPLRRHKRKIFDNSQILMPGIILIDHSPSNRRQVLNVLAHYYKQKNRPRPKLIDISAGGVCLETNDPVCQKFMGAAQHYLFFFFLQKNGVISKPNIFLAKKVGIFRNGAAKHAGLRIRFLREMLWNGPLDELKWADIEAEGSETIQELIDAQERREKDALSARLDSVDE